MAVRSRLSTIMMRVKPVIMSSMAGRKESMVSKTNVSTLNDQVWLPSAPGVEVRAGKVACATDSSGKASRRASNRPEKNRRCISSLATLQRTRQGGGEAGVVCKLLGVDNRRIRRGRGQGMQQVDLLRCDAQHQSGVLDFNNHNQGPATEVLRSENTQRLCAGSPRQPGTTHCPRTRQ